VTDLTATLDTYVGKGSLPGAVALLARGDQTEVHVVGSLGRDHDVPMARDSIFRIASITKPIAAAAVMLLVDEGRIELDDPVTGWLPELSSPQVVRTPTSPVDDVIAADRPWNVPGRYGWVGGTGTSAHLVPSSGTVALLLTHVGVTSPAPTPLVLELLALRRRILTLHSSQGSSEPMLGPMLFMLYGGSGQVLRARPRRQTGMHT